MLLDDACLALGKKQVHMPRKSCGYSWFSLYHFHAELLINKPKYICGPATQFKGSEHPESTNCKCLTYIIPATLNPIEAWEPKNSSETHKSTRLKHTEQQKQWETLLQSGKGEASSWMLFSGFHTDTHTHSSSNITHTSTHNTHTHVCVPIPSDTSPPTF